MRSVILCSLLFVTGQAFAEKQPVVAILPFQNKDAAAGEEMAARISTEIVNRQAFPVAERNQLRKALEELARGQSGLFNEGQAPQLGKMLGAEYLILGEILPSTDRTLKATMRVIRAETGVVIGAAVNSGDAESLSREFSASAIKTISIHSMLDNPDSPYTVLLQLNKGKNPQYKLGEKLQLKFKVLKHDPYAPTRVYVSIYSIGGDGTMTLIYPNRFSGNEGVIVDKEYAFPGEKDDFEWKLVPPAGAETIQAIVSSKPVRLQNERSTSAFTVLPAKESQAMYRGIQTELKEEKRGDWAAERVTYILKD
ncbi:MAG: DUF4384 domain-containing protein [Spirochaetia bacterium]|nr:DUF4384 domain-containing protein [Spirochaetia bacterium]